MTVLAQVLLKKASYFEFMTAMWFWYMALSAVVYSISFILYSRILKYYPLNKIFPVLIVGQIILITFYGMLIGETVTGRHALGLVLGGVAIYLILL